VPTDIRVIVPTAVSTSIGSLRGEYLSLGVKVVDPSSGSDSNSGSDSSPWETVEHAVDTAISGEIVLLRGGTYTPTRDVSDSFDIAWSVANSGTSSNPIVFANYPGESVTILADGPSNNIIGSDGSDYIWWDGVTVDCNGGNGRFGMISNNAVGCRFRHCRFTNAVLAGGGSNYGMVHTPNRNDYTIIEYCQFDNCSSSTSSVNDAGMLLYKFNGGTVQYCVFDGISNQSVVREKDPAEYNVIGQAVRYYRNVFKNSSERGVHIGDGYGSNPTFYGTYHFEENLLIGSSLHVDSDTTEQGEFRDWLYKNNTAIDGYFFRGGTIDGGMRRLIDFRVYNNIRHSATVDSGYVFRWQQPSDADTNFDHGIWNDTNQPNYNGFSLADTADWFIQYRYPSFTETWATHQGRGYDVNSIQTTSPAFVDAANDDYRLDTGSPFLNAGRESGNSGDATVDMGCFFEEYWEGDAGPSPM